MLALERLVALALGVVAPASCVECEAPLGGGTTAPFCSGCLRLVEGPLVERVFGLTCIALGRYSAPLESAVHHLKYDGRPDLARPLGERLAEALRAVAFPGPCTLVPVPLHPLRLCSRGYNQSALLARSLGASLGWPVAPLALARTRATGQQAALGPGMRAENVKDAFRATRLQKRGPVLLVDDVFTTLSTVRECARALQESGAEVAGVIAVARGGSWAVAGTERT